MPDAATATDIISFGPAGAGVPSPAARIDYSVPANTSHGGRRTVMLDLGLTDNDWLPAAFSGGSAPKQRVGLDDRGASATEHDFSVPEATDYFISLLRAQAAPSDLVRAIEVARSALTTQPVSFGSQFPDEVHSRLRDVATRLDYHTRVAPMRAGLALDRPRRALPDTGPAFGAELGTVPGLQPDDPIPLPGIPELEDYLKGIRLGRLLLPRWRWPGHIELVPIPPEPAPEPALFLVEEYRVTSRYGNYGLGRTVRTFSLLPGETTEISVETWRTDETKAAQSSSVVDSFSTKAAERFSNKLETKAATQTSDSRSEAYAFDINAKVWGWGVVVGGEVAAGYSSNVQVASSRQDFAETVTGALSEHTSEANSERESVVSSTSEHLSEQGERTRTTRQLKNVNLRRTLNFVFRELNQSYTTYVHLVDIRVAFSNGRPGSLREVPLSGLRALLESVLVGASVATTCQKILKMAGTAIDHDDLAVQLLDQVTLSDDGTKVVVDQAKLVGGQYPVPDGSTWYRFRPGPLGDPAIEGIDGVVVAEHESIMRTDSLLVEALMGQADALDDYALGAQEADLAHKNALAERETIANAGLQGLSGEQFAEAFHAMFNQDGKLNVAIDHVGP